MGQEKQPPRSASPVGLANGVTHQGPRRFNGRGRWAGKGQEGVGFGFIPATWWRGIGSGPNFLLFASFSKYILKMTRKPCLCRLPILPIPAHSSFHVQPSFCPSPQPIYSYVLILSFHQFILLSRPVMCLAIHSPIHPLTHPSIHMTTHPSIRPSIHSSIHSSIHLSIHYYIPTIA